MRAPDTGVLTGRVLDEAGEPVAGVMVMVMPPERVMGKDRLLKVGGSGRSDSTGQFRIAGLPPDSFYVFACPPPFCASNIHSALDARHELTFHPSAADLSAAVRVRVSAGDEIPGVDIVLRDTARHELAGTVIDENGRPGIDMPLMLFPGGDVQVGVSAETTTSMGGRFSFGLLPAGRYVLKTGAPRSPALPVFASAVIDLAGDAREWTIQVRPGTTVRGEIVFDAAPPVFHPERVQLAARPGDTTQAPVGMMTATDVRVHEDWTFDVTNIWGPQKLEVLKRPDGWMLKAIEAGGIDHTDSSIDLEAVARTSATLRVVFTRQVSSVAGRVRDQRGVPVRAADVLVYPTDSRLWDVPSRFIRATTTDEHGRYVLTHVPPGDYQLVALDRLPAYRATRVDVLEGLRSLAVPISVDVGEKKQSDLTVRTFQDF